MKLINFNYKSNSLFTNSVTNEGISNNTGGIHYLGIWGKGLAFFVHHLSEFIGFAVIMLFCLGIYFLYHKGLGPLNRKEYIHRIKSKNEKLINLVKANFQKDIAAGSELKSVSTNFHRVYFPYPIKINRSVAVLAEAFESGISLGEIPKGSGVEVLLYALNGNKFKVKYHDLCGWVPASVLDMPKEQLILAKSKENINP